MLTFKFYNTRLAITDLDLVPSISKELDIDIHNIYVAIYKIVTNEEDSITINDLVISKEN